MNRTSPFDPPHFKQVYLEAIAQQASMAWDKFQRIERTVQVDAAKPLSIALCDMPEQAGKRYAKHVLKYKDPTSIESVINAAFSNLCPKALMHFKMHLKQHYLQAHSNLHNLASF